VAGAGAEQASGAETAEEPDLELASLLPPGPLEALRVSPARIRVECGASKRVRAVGLDSTGRPVQEEMTFHWRLEGPVGGLARGDAAAGGAAGAATLAPSDAGDAETTAPQPAAALETVAMETIGVGARGEVVLRAADEPGEGKLIVVARSGAREIHAEIPVEVLDEIPNARSSEGIPEPEFVSQPGAGWRSRMQEGRWQVNSAHRDYLAVADRPPLKLRYLAMLFAKEIVLRSHQDPRLEAPLEQLVEVAVFADLSLASRPRPGRRGRSTTAPEPSP